MEFLDVLTKPRRIPSFLLGILCLGAALIQLWLALGPSKNLPTDTQEMEAAIQETHSVVHESQDLLKHIQDTGSDRQATQRLFEQMKQENEKWKRQQENRQARLSASSRRKRLGFAAMATIFMLIAAKFLIESLRGQTRRGSTAPG